MKWTRTLENVEQRTEDSRLIEKEYGKAIQVVSRKCPVDILPRPQDLAEVSTAFRLNMLQRATLNKAICRLFSSLSRAFSGGSRLKFFRR